MATRRHVDTNGEQYRKGDRVRIQSGSYVDHLYGTFVDYCGDQKVYVKVDNDTAAHRRLMKKSIRHVTQRDRRLHGPLVNGTPKANGAKAKAAAPNIDDNDITSSVLNDLSCLKKAITDIELKLKSYKSYTKK